MGAAVEERLLICLFVEREAHPVITGTLVVRRWEFPALSGVEGRLQAGFPTEPNLDGSGHKIGNDLSAYPRR